MPLPNIIKNYHARFAGGSMKVKEVKIRKLFEGKVSIRSYIVQEAIKENISLLLKLTKTDEIMLITPENLLKRENDHFSLF